MTDERMRRLERAAAQGDEKDRAAYLAELGRSDARVHELDAELGRALEVARAAVNQQLRDRFPAIREDQLCPPLEVAPLIEAIAGALEPQSGFQLGFGSARVYRQWPMLFALAVRDGMGVVVRLRHLSEQPTLGSAWPGLRGLSDKRKNSPRTTEPQLRAWLLEPDANRVELPIELARLRADVQRVRPAPPAPKKSAPPDRTRPTSAQLSTIASLRAQLGVDDPSFAQLMVDEGWLQPFDQLTRAWASVIIDALKEALRAKSPAPSPEKDDLPEIETDQGEGLFATEAQVDFFKVLKRRKGLDLAAVREQLRLINAHERLETVSRRTMSDLLDALKALPDR